MTRTSTGSVALALLVASCAAGCSNKSRKAEAEAESAAREQFARTAVIDAGAARMLTVASRADVLFEEGFGIVSYDPPDDFHNAAFRWMGQRGHVRVHSHGDRAMHLKITGWLHEKVLRAKGVVSFYLDGRLIGDTGAVESGNWGFETVVPSAVVHGAGWMDLIIAVSTVAYHWSDPPELRVVVINDFEWWESP